MKQQTVKICGFKKQEILTSLARFKDRGVDFEVSEKHLDVEIKITAPDIMSKADFDGIVADVVGPFKAFFYSENEDNLAERAYKLLKFTKNTVSVAESLTGGEVAAKLISVPGVSEVFYEGIVAYSNQAKEDRLGVRLETLKTDGAVSRRCAGEMVDGLLLTGRATVAVSTTGIAGPSGGSRKKPVGTVYIAVGDEHHVEIFRNVFEGDRDEVRGAASNMALLYLIKFLKGELLELRLYYELNS